MGQYRGLPICSAYFHAVFVVGSPTSSICGDLSNVVVVFWYRCECVSECVLFWCFYYEKAWRGAEQLLCVFLCDLWYRPVEKMMCSDCMFLVYITEQFHRDV